MGAYGVFSNRALMAALVSWFIAQVIKVACTLFSEKRIDVSRMYGAGGMPSSHSSLVMAITTYVGKTNGVESSLFAICCVFSMVVMYDAAGVRRAAGKQAKAINLLFTHTELKKDEHLKELLGHTPFQVFAGAILGILVGLIY